MTTDFGLDAEYLHPSDAAILDIYEREGTLWIQFAVPDPESDKTYKLDARVEEVAETDMEIPLEDAEDHYD